MRRTFAFIALVMFSITLVSAASSTGLGARIAYGMEQAIDIVSSTVGPLLSVFLGGTGDFLLERVLFLLIVFSFVYVVLSKKVAVFDGQPALVWIISIAVSLLATRFLTETEMIKTMLLPYSVLGVAITAIIPTIIYFFFVRGFDESSSTSILRKILWLFYGIVFIGLWSSRYTELGSISWIYFWTAMAAFFFFLFDGTIHRAIMRQRYGNMGEGQRLRLVGDLKEELDRVAERERRGIYDKRMARKARRDLSRQIKNLLKGKFGQ